MPENQFLNFLNGNILEELDYGISYDLLSENYMTIKQDIRFNGQKAKMLSVGILTRDFTGYFNNIR
jgi:hypothetical protein